MCLVSVAWQCSDDYPFVFAGNRDEFHGRASAAADWWEDQPDVLGGRDLVAGGSWLGINRAGDFAVVTNRPDLPAPADNALSRGALVTEPLRSSNGSGNHYGNDQPTWLRQLATDSHRYGGFSLLAGNVRPGTAGTLSCYSGGNGMDVLLAQTVGPGVFGLSNTGLDDPWPKLTWLNEQLQQQAANPDPDKLFQLLLREEPVPDADTDWVSARPFIVGDEYGTRSATVVTINAAGECLFIEKRFGSGGTPEGETAERFSLTAG